LLGPGARHSALTGTLLLRRRAFFPSLRLPDDSWLPQDIADSCRRMGTATVTSLQHPKCRAFAGPSFNLHYFFLDSGHKVCLQVRLSQRFLPSV